MSPGPRAGALPVPALAGLCLEPEIFSPIRLSSFLASLNVANSSSIARSDYWWNQAGFELESPGQILGSK